MVTKLTLAPALAASVLCVALASCGTPPRATTDRAEPPVEPTPHEPMIDNALNPVGGIEESYVERRFTTVRLQVDGIRCPIRCAREVKEMLKPVEGVVDVIVDYPTRTVHCTVKTGTDPDTLLRAVHNPYRARLL